MINSVKEIDIAFNSFKGDGSINSKRFIWNIKSDFDIKQISKDKARLFFAVLVMKNAGSVSAAQLLTEETERDINLKVIINSLNVKL